MKISDEILREFSEALPYVVASMLTPTEIEAALSAVLPKLMVKVRRQALEEACDVIEGNSTYDQQLCCNGHMCGCYGATVHQQMQHHIRALSAEPAQAEQWRDMKDAPKDGTKIDVWMMPHGYRETDVFWSDIQDAWCRESEYPDEPTPLSVVPYPAFWMPLPSAPTTEE